MERPVIKDDQITKYVDYLEAQLKNFQSELPLAKMYLSKLKWVDYIIGIQEDLIEEREREDEEDKITLKDDKETKDLKKERKAKSVDRMLDRCLKIQEDILKTAKDLKELESLTNPKTVLDVTREAGSDYEARLNKLNA